MRPDEDTLRRIAMEAVERVLAANAPNLEGVFAERDQLRAQRDAVLDLHQRERVHREESRGFAEALGLVGARCIECGRRWPCPTKRAFENNPK